MTEKRKTALITGGAKRLGKEICLKLAESCYNIAFSYLTSEKESKQTEEQIKRLGVDALRYKTDLTDYDQVKEFFKYAHKSFGKISVLINNASVFNRTPFNELNHISFDNTIAANLSAYYYTSLEASKYMKKEGRIINISSLGGTKPYKNYLPYSVSKAGVDMLTKCLALELAPRILVNSIAPGVLKMKGEKRKEYLPTIESIPLKKHGNTIEITNFILYLINSEYITGQIFLIDGGKVLN